MKILIDIGHPGHVHLFKNFAFEMQNRGHQILFTTRDKEYEIELLKEYNLYYVSLGKKFKSKFGKMYGLILFNLKLLLVSLKFKPDIFLSHGSFYAAHVSYILRKKHICFEDSGNSEQVRLYLPFTETVLTSDVFPYDYGDKQIRYKSHHEIAYLHKNYFVNEKVGDENYAILRLVSWNASHDIDQKGLSPVLLEKIINVLEQKKVTVYISSEGVVSDYLKDKLIKIKPHEMHSYLANAKIFIGEGATMAMEAAVLGTPAIYINTIKRSYCDDIAKFGLCLSSMNEKDIFSYIESVFCTRKEKFNNISTKYIESKIDLTSFSVWFIENYPESAKIMKNNPDYQYRFK
jgi:predicted glycosyltransferase